MVDNKEFLFKGAMYYGFILGLYWAFKYIFFIISLYISSFYLIFIGMSLAVPFIAGYLTLKYKEKIGGFIRFSHAWQFGVWLYFFAALILSIEHFIFYQYIAPPDFIKESLEQTMNLLKDYKPAIQATEAIEQIDIRPISLTIQGIFNNIFYGIILSIPVAFFVSKHNNNTSSQQTNI